MKSFLLCVFTISIVFAQIPNNGRQLQVEIPNDWVELLRNQEYRHDSSRILKNIYHILSPRYDSAAFFNTNESLPKDSLTNKENNYSSIEIKVFSSIIFVNLDEDKEEEMLGLFGESMESTKLGVFNQIDGKWFIIFAEDVETFYVGPELGIANTPSQCKPFYVRQLYTRGSGIYGDGYHFYKLIKGIVYPCLQIVNESHIYGWGMPLNQTVNTHFQSDAIGSDDIWVTYRYRFFPGALDKGDFAWEGHDDIIFAESNDEGVTYAWDSLSHTYKPNEYGLSAEKLECLNSLGNSELFIVAFAKELEELKQKGSRRQRVYLRKFLKEVEQMKTRKFAPNMIEEAGEIDGVRFYNIEK